MANRFRLVQQPIASLVGEDRPMFDLVVRMLDERGQEVLPSEFLPPPIATDLMKNIDRWIVGAAMSFCAAQQAASACSCGCRAIRCATRRSATWLQQQLKASRIEPEPCRHPGERGDRDTASEGSQGAAAAAFARSASSLRSRTSARGRDPAAAARRTCPVNYVKIDGSLMQGLANDRPLQERVKALVEQARERSITTIAERVEDANTMAVLWQLGIEFIQGYFVNSPEEVVTAA